MEGGRTIDDWTIEDWETWAEFNRHYLDLHPKWKAGHNVLSMCAYHIDRLKKEQAQAKRTAKK